MNVTNPDQRDKVIRNKSSELSKMKQQNTCETWKHKKRDQQYVIYKTHF